MTPEKALEAAIVGSPAPGLLDDAARYAAARRATVRTSHLDAPAPAPEQEPHQPTQAFADVMDRVLSHPQAVSVPLVCDTLLLLRRRAMVLPTRLLAPVISVARENPEVASALPPVLGARGRWLVGLDPTWLGGGGTTEPAPADWDEGTIAERVAWLRLLRQSDPDAGRALVAGTGREKAADRAQLVEALEVELGLADEELLEELLRDRSKKVGGAAARLLARLDGSAYLERAVALARASFARAETPATGVCGGLHHPEATIVGTAPPDKAVAADHHAVVVPVPKGPAGRLVAVVGVVPPHRWGDLGVSVTELDTRLLLDDESIDVTDALTQAVLRWKDVDAARALLARHADPRLALILPPGESDVAMEKVIRTAAADCGATVETFALLCTQLDTFRDLTLTPDAAEALLDGVTACIAHKRPVPSAASRLLAYNVDPERAAQVLSRLTGLSHDTDVPSMVQRRLSEAVTALTFRQSIYESMKEPR